MKREVGNCQVIFDNEMKRELLLTVALVDVETPRHSSESFGRPTEAKSTVQELKDQLAGNIFSHLHKKQTACLNWPLI